MGVEEEVVGPLLGVVVPHRMYYLVATVKMKVWKGILVIKWGVFERLFLFSNFYMREDGDGMSLSLSVSRLAHVKKNLERERGRVF